MGTPQGKKSGQGTLTITNEQGRADVYKGAFKNNLVHGEPNIRRGRRSAGVEGCPLSPYEATPPPENAILSPKKVADVVSVSSPR
eukprot:4241641-Pyramimonas_sp.AAC.1